MKALEAIAIVLTCAGGFTACIGEGKTPDSGTGGVAGGGGTCQVPPDAGECTIIPFCGCTSDKNCIPLDQSGVTACVPTGGVKENRGCNSGSDCAPGLQCLSGVCHSTCGSNETCNGASPYCDKTITSPIAGLGLCATQCNLVNPGQQGVCGPGVNCFVIDIDAGLTDCRGLGTGTGKGGCPTGSQHECAPGYNCLDGTVDCAKWCRSSQGGTDCPAPKTCTTPVITIGVEGFGFCT